MPCRQGCNNLNLNWLAEDVLAVKSCSAQCELFIPVTFLKCYRPLAEHYLVWGESTNIWKEHRLVDNLKFTVRRGAGVRSSPFSSSCCCAWPANSPSCVWVLLLWHFLGQNWTVLQWIKASSQIPPKPVIFFLPLPFIKGNLRTEHKDAWRSGWNYWSHLLGNWEHHWSQLEVETLFFSSCLTTLAQSASQSSVCWNCPISSCAEYCASSVCLLGTSDRVVEQRCKGLWSTCCHEGWKEGNCVVWQHCFWMKAENLKWEADIM